jgi:hypothetical protein
MQIYRIARLLTVAIGMSACALRASELTAQTTATPPFDTSPEAVAARTAVYSVAGRADLTGLHTPLADGTKIDGACHQRPIGSSTGDVHRPADRRHNRIEARGQQGLTCVQLAWGAGDKREAYGERKSADGLLSMFSEH